MAPRPDQGFAVPGAIGGDDFVLVKFAQGGGVCGTDPQARTGDHLAPAAAEDGVGAQGWRTAVLSRAEASITAQAAAST